MSVLTDPWRAVCPEGHSNWRANETGYYCIQCREHFAQLRDKKTGELVA